MPWRSSSLESRCRQRIRSTRTASRARTRSRNASSSSPGTLTGCSFPASSSRASNSASRRSVFTRSPLARGILLGAATTHSTPRFASSRASPYPVGPASYATLAGRGNPAQKPAAPALSPLIVNVCSSPVSASSTTATIFAACTSKPTRVLAFVMAGSSYAIVVAARVRAAQHEHHPTNSMGEPASSTPPAGQTSNPYCLVHSHFRGHTSVTQVFNMAENCRGRLVEGGDAPWSPYAHHWQREEIHQPREHAGVVLLNSQGDALIEGTDALVRRHCQDGRLAPVQADPARQWQLHGDRIELQTPALAPAHHAKVRAEAEHRSRLATQVDATGPREALHLLADHEDVVGQDRHAHARQRGQH